MRGLARVLIPAAALMALLPAAASAKTIDEVRGRGQLVCGVSEGLPGFSNRDKAGAWTGFDVDFCRAIAAAVLGDPAKVEFVPLAADARFAALKDGKIDVLSRNSTWTMSRDAGLGIDFAGVAYYDGQGFLVPTSFGFTSALQLEGARICVISGTTTEENATKFFAGRKIKVTFMRFETRGAAREAYGREECDVFTADSSALAAERSLLPAPAEHMILPEIISKEPLGPATREDDPAWTDLVRWTLFGLITAEEQKLTAASVKASRDQAAALGKPAAAALGLGDDWLAVVVGAVGNYGEIFDRNLGPDTPLGLERGINAPWNAGGILYAPPMQ